MCARGIKIEENAKPPVAKNWDKGSWLEPPVLYYWAMINGQPPALITLLYTPHIKILDTPAEQPKIFYYYEEQLLIVP